MHVGAGDHGAVHQPSPAVVTHMHLHAEVPLVAFPGLAHPGIALAIGVLGRTGRGNDGGVQDDASAQAQATLLQDAANFGEDGLAQCVFLQQVPELQDGGGIRPRRGSIKAANSAQGTSVCISTNKASAGWAFDSAQNRQIRRLPMPRSFALWPRSSA